MDKRRSANSAQVHLLVGLAAICSQIDGLHQTNHVPLVVGGTAYWLQHLLFPDRLAALKDGSGTPGPSPSFKQALASLSPEQHHIFDALATIVPESTPPALALSLHGLLTTLDPIIANRWHWKDTRKVLRSLEIIQEHQSLASEVFAAQNERQITSSEDTELFCSG